MGKGGSFWSDVLGALSFAVSAIVNTIGLALEGLNAVLKVAEGIATFIAGVGMFDQELADKGSAMIAKGSTLGGQAVDNFIDNIRESLVSSFKVGSSDDKTTETGGLGGNVTGGGLGTSGGSSTKESAGSSVSGIQSKVRNITINIQKMVETINFNSITNAQSEAELVNAVKRALLTAVSDVNVISR